MHCTLVTRGVKITLPSRLLAQPVSEIRYSEHDLLTVECATDCLKSRSAQTAKTTFVLNHKNKNMLLAIQFEQKGVSTTPMRPSITDLQMHLNAFLERQARASVGPSCVAKRFSAYPSDGRPANVKSG
mmetsp:Transcript_142123/g.247759  ORF Transcript_142123/g.247759 Transcript_142123/m.247759 type:complete len:128 (-) Transcript_142123:382-765(-)